MTTPFVTHERVRWADVDLVGIMRYSAFTRLIEFADQEMFRAAGIPYSLLTRDVDTWLPRRRMTVEYHAPALLDEQLSLVSYVSRFGDTSMTMNFDVRRTGDWALVATADLVVVCVLAATFVKCALPSATREALSQFHCSVDTARAWVPAKL